MKIDLSARHCLLLFIPLLLITGIFPSNGYTQSCQDWIAKVVSVQGQILAQKAGTQKKILVKLNDIYYLRVDKINRLSKGDFYLVSSGEVCTADSVDILDKIDFMINELFNELPIFHKYNLVIKKEDRKVLNYKIWLSSITVTNEDQEELPNTKNG